MRYCTIALVVWMGWVSSVGAEIMVGSKKFTESMVLGEIASKVLRDAGFSVTHKSGMGGTIIVWQALKSGAISVYPDYTGTISQQILKSKQKLDVKELRSRLKPLGIGITDALGFNNTYALAMRRKQAQKLCIQRISDLRRYSHLKFGLTHEFINRQDGWRELSRHYQLPSRQINGTDHALGYSALLSGRIDVKDAYSTDAKFANDALLVLDDDKDFFPSYQGVYLYRLSLPEKAKQTLNRLAGTIPQKKMIMLNQAAEKHKNYTLAAALYFSKDFFRKQTATLPSFWSKLLRWTGQHMYMVLLSMFFAILLGIPLGIWASRPGTTSQVILGTVGVIQTIPSLALLALLVPLAGISSLTAIVALFLYSLLPIVRNTATGISEVPPSLRESAEALGLPPFTQLRKIYLPLASPTIMAGIKTSAVINVGTATLAALIGVGGLGEPIISGLNLNDHNIILQGAIPAALLTIIVQLSFEWLERWVIPKGLRSKRS